MNLPEGYGATQVNEVEGFACSAALAWLESVLRMGTDLHEWAAARDPGEALSGRGPVHAIPAPVAGPDGCARWAFRRYLRGGFAARVLGDRYLRSGETRPVREVWASAEARARGVRTPAAIAGAVYPARRFYRADLVTELVPNGLSLARVVFGDGAPADASGSLQMAGRLVRTLEGTRVLHEDLNAGNIVLAEDDEGEAAWVIDLDRCRVLPRSARRPERFMRRRLERSLRKLSEVHDRALSAAEWEALRTGFEERA